MNKKITIAVIAILLVVAAIILVPTDGIKLEKPASDAPSRIVKQYEQEKEWLDELKSGDYTIDNPMIVQDPYESNKLSAYIAFNYDQAVSYEYTVNGDAPFTYAGDITSKQVVIPVVALYNNVDNKVDVKLTSKSGEEVENTTFTISTKDTGIENDTTDVDVKREDDFHEYMDGKWIVDNFINVFDQNGDLRADSVSKYASYAGMKFYDNQFLVMDRNEADDKDIDAVFSYTMIGRLNPNIYFMAPEGTKFHHDLEVANGKLYVLTSTEDEDSEFYTGTVENLVSIYDYNSGKYEETFDLQDFYNADDLMNVGAAPNDVHYNSLSYYEEGNLMLINSRSYSGFIAIDLDTNEPVWLLDRPDTVSDKNKDLLLEEIGDMEYPAGEHTAYVVNDMPGGKDGMLYVSVFDNRQCVDKDGKEYEYDHTDEASRDYGLCMATPPSGSRGIVYEIDPVNLTVSTFDVIDFANYSAYKGGYNIFANGYRTTYVADMNKFEIYNPDSELVAVYTLGGVETATSEDGPFLYRAVAYDTEEVQNYVEVNQA